MFVEERQTKSPTIEGLQNLLDQARDELHGRAQSCADRFWENHLQLDKAEGTNKPSSLGCRVRQKGDGVYMEWYYNTWRKKINGSSQPFSRHISKSARGFHYDLRKLYAHAPEWEYPMIRETESAFANLRQQNSQLTAMRRNLQSLSRLELKWEEQVHETSEDDWQDL